MKLLFIAAAMAVTIFSTSAQAAPTASDAATPAPSKQQNRMKTCNADAKTKALKGDERKAFMKECLSNGKSSASAEKASAGDKVAKSDKSEKAEKTKACGAEAKGKALKGDERKSFVKECVSRA